MAGDDDNNEDVDDIDNDDGDDDDDEDELLMLMMVVMVVLINNCRCTQRYILVILIFVNLMMTKTPILSKAKTITSGRGHISLGQN